MPFTAGSVNTFLPRISKWGVLDRVLMTYRVGDFFAVIVSLPVVLKKCRRVTEKWFLCVRLGCDWILWGVNVHLCHLLNSSTSKGINLAMPNIWSESRDSVHFASPDTHWRCWPADPGGCDLLPADCPPRKVPWRHASSGLRQLRCDCQDEIELNSSTFFFFRVCFEVWNLTGF